MSDQNPAPAAENSRPRGAAPEFSVCVYCGSRDGGSPAYAAAAEELGRALAAQSWRLVYGAGDVGLMGRVARATVPYWIIHLLAIAVLTVFPAIALFLPDLLF